MDDLLKWQVVPQLLSEFSFSPELWRPFAKEHAAALWAACASSRMPSEGWKAAFKPMARHFLKQELLEWREESPSAPALEFAALVTRENIEQDANSMRESKELLMCARPLPSHPPSST